MKGGARIDLAIAALRQGDLGRAQVICREALQLDPFNADASRVLGIVACQSGNYAGAVGFLQTSLAIRPAQADAHTTLGGALVMLRQPQQAMAHFERALALRPGLPEAHYSRGCALYELQRYEEAIADFDVVLRRAPRHFSALLNRSNAQHKLGRLEEALASLERATAEKPDDASALYNQGNVLRDLGRPAAALVCYDRAIALNPSSADLLNNRGNVLRDVGRLSEALESYEQAMRLAPKALEPLNNRGTTLLNLHRTRDAIACFEEALRRQPGCAMALDNLGLALRMENRPEDAVPVFAELLRVAPGFKGVRTNLHHARCLCCDWSQYAEGANGVIESVRRGSPENPFPFLALSQSPADQQRCAQQFAADQGWLRPALPLSPPGRRRHGRIKVAYVSADFLEHPVSVLLAGVLEQHDRESFEIIGVSLRPQDSSGIGQRIRSAFDRFVDATRCSDTETAGTLCDLEVDIAVDLMGYSRWSRPGIFAQRPAPVQVNYLGYPGTMGVPFMDYIIADGVVIPEGHESFYTEKVIRLPHCFLPNDDRREIAARIPSRAEAGLPEHGIVFCAFTSAYKLNPTVFSTWMRLLLAIPESVLWLRGVGERGRSNLKRAAEERGVNGDRLLFASRVPEMADHLVRQQLADLYLDTLPYNGHSSACDALWAGLPVLTCAGHSFASRVAASALTSAGLPELITHNLDEYEHLALELAREPERLRQLRARLASNRHSHALFSTATYSRNLESAYRSMLEASS